MCDQIRQLSQPLPAFFAKYVLDGFYEIRRQVQSLLTTRRETMGCPCLRNLMTSGWASAYFERPSLSHEMRPCEYVARYDPAVTLSPCRSTSVLISFSSAVIFSSADSRIGLYSESSASNSAWICFRISVRLAS